VAGLAAWRLRLALELDRPINWVLHERALLDVAKHRPATAGELRATKGISTLAKQHADELIALLAAIDVGAFPRTAPRPPSRPTSPRAQRWAELLLAIVQLVADQHGLAGRLLATRHDAEAFARAIDERGLDGAVGTAAMSTWRRDVIGRVWVDWLAGRVALAGDLEAPHGVALRPR
jgi:ribonuclease D